MKIDRTSPAEITWAACRAADILEGWRIREDDKLRLVLPVLDTVAVQEIAAAILDGVRAGLDRSEAIVRDAGQHLLADAMKAYPV